MKHKRAPWWMLPDSPPSTLEGKVGALSEERKAKLEARQKELREEAERAATFEHIQSMLRILTNGKYE